MGHSSLLADTGLSATKLDRLGIRPVEREPDPGVSSGGWYDPKMRHGKIVVLENYTWPPFLDRPWYTDEDVARCLPREQEWWGRA